MDSPNLKGIGLFNMQKDEIMSKSTKKQKKKGVFFGRFYSCFKQKVPQPQPQPQKRAKLKISPGFLMKIWRDSKIINTWKDS